MNDTVSSDSWRWRTVAIFVAVGAVAVLVGGWIDLHTAGPADPKIPPVLTALVENGLSALPFIAAWPAAAFAAGYRRTALLAAAAAIAALAWVLPGVVHDVMNVEALAIFPVDRELAGNLMFVGGWAGVAPQMRHVEYFLVAAGLALLGAGASWAFAMGLAGVSDGDVFWPQNLLLNLPMFALIGYGLGERRPTDP